MNTNIKNFELFFNSYSDNLKKKLKEISIKNLYSAVKVIEKTIVKKNLFMYVEMVDLPQ